jgi:hypothetical protein
MHQIEDLANFVRIGEIPQNVNIGQGLGKWPENRNQEVPLEAQTRILTRTDFTELVSREQVGGMRVVMCIVGSSPTEFTLVDYPTMDELEIY